MNSLSEKLRTARESRGLSLDDIAAATRIQLYILKAIEEGNFSLLPQPYTRAFIRSYAKEVGLNEAEILRDYDELCQQLIPPSQNPRKISHPWKKSRAGTSQNNVLVIIAGALIVSLVGSLSVFNREKHVSEVKEVPFQEVVKQREISSPVVVDRVDSIEQQTPAAPTAFTNAPVQRDSAQKPPRPPLMLRAMTFDSVWIRILIDGEVRKEYYAPPRWSGQWKATDHFLISVSNASAVSLTLNNAALGMIGKPGKPVQNFLVQHRVAPSHQERKNKRQ